MNEKSFGCVSRNLMMCMHMIGTINNIQDIMIDSSNDIVSFQLQKPSDVSGTYS